MPDLVADRVLDLGPDPQWCPNHGVPDRVLGLTRYQVSYQILNLFRTSARLEKEIDWYQICCRISHKIMHQNWYQLSV